MKTLIVFLFLLIPNLSYSSLGEDPNVEAIAWRSMISGHRYFISKHALDGEPVFILTTISEDNSRPYKVISESVYKNYLKEITELTKAYKYPDPKIFSCENNFIIETKAPNKKAKSRAFCMAGFSKAAAQKISTWEKNLDQMFQY